MQVDNAVAHPWLGEIGGFAMLMQYFVEELLRAGMVVFPPSAYSGHVVGGCGAHTVVRIRPRVPECCRRVFRHALDFQGENFQLVHDRRNACWNHAEVFGAYKHVGGIDQRGQFPHGFAVPEVVVAAVEKVVVQSVEAPTLIVGE